MAYTERLGMIVWYVNLPGPTMQDACNVSPTCAIYARCGPAQPLRPTQRPQRQKVIKDAPLILLGPIDTVITPVCHSANLQDPARLVDLIALSSIPRSYVIRRWSWV